MEQTGERWRLGHRPALDGLRGVAVLLVVVHHTNLLHWLPGLGAVGVTVFFVLSGYLITSLLLAEWDRTGRIDLRRFAVRRVRRLVPALAVFLVAMTALSAAGLRFLVDPDSLIRALLYVGNWKAANGGDMGALLHTWSLSVEEQFYIAFPLLAWAALRWRGRHGVLVVSALFLVASAIDRVALWAHGASFDRLYYATDTQASSLLLGCVLAAVLAGRALRVRPAPAAAAAIVALFATSSNGWAVPLVASACAVVVIGCVGGASTGVLASHGLRLVGQRSYALYLWHVPLLWLATFLPVTAWEQVGLAVAASWLLAEASWRFVEQPFMRARLRPRPVAPEAAFVTA